MKGFHRPFTSCVLQVAGIVLVCGWPGGAGGQATVVWDGDGSGDMIWTQPDSNSWSGGTYVAGDHAQFLGDGSGTVTISGVVSPGSVLVNSGATYIFTGGSIGGAASLTKGGPGLLVLGSANSYSGATVVDGGILRPTVAGAVATAPVVNAGGTFDGNGLNHTAVAAQNITVAGQGAFGVVGALTNTAAGETQFQNVNLTGNTTIGTSAGKLNIFGALSGGGNILTVGGSGETNIRPSATLDNLAGIIVGTTAGGRLRFESNALGGTLNPANPTPITVNPGGRVDTYVNGANRTYGANLSLSLNGGILEANGASVHTAAWDGSVAVLANSSIQANRRIDLFGPVSGTGTITKTGGDTLNFRGGINSLGGIQANAGRVRFESEINPGSPFTVSVNSGGVVDTWIATGTRTMGANVTLNLNGGQLESSGGGNHRWNGPVTVSANSTVQANHRLDFYGSVSGTGVITKTGGQVLVFRGAGVSSLGGLQINAGRVRFEEGGFGAWAGPITINSGGILSGWGNQTLAATVTLNGGTMSVENGGTGTYNGAVTASSASMIDVGSGGIVVNGALSGAGNLAKMGGGSLQLNGDATGYTGTLTVGSGVFRAANTAALPVSLSIASGATFDANAVNFGARDITIAGNGASGFVGAWTNTGAGEGWIRGITLAADARIGTNGSKINSAGIINGGGNTLTIGGGGETNFRGGTQLTNLAGITVATTGGGRLRLEGDIAPAGLQTITIQPGARVDTWGTRSLGSNLGLVLAGGILEAQGSGGATKATWNGPVGVTVPSTVNTTNANGSLRHITLAGPVSGAGDVNKVGPATLELTGDNSAHSGNIQVSEGVLLVNNGAGSGTGAGLVTVLSGARVGGNGVIGMGGVGDGLVVQSGGILAPGNSPGTLTVLGTATLQAGSVFEVDVRNPGTDLLVVSGGVSLDGSNLSVLWGGGQANVFAGNYNSDSLNWLIQNDSAMGIAGTFANSVANPGFAGLFGGVTPHLVGSGGQLFALFYEADLSAVGSFSAANLVGGNDLLLIAIPEPSRAVLLVLASGAMLIRRRARRA
jgi:fibronectin-binding autotransporter adhesin